MDFGFSKRSHEKEICYTFLRRGVPLPIMPLWQTVVMDKWLLVKDLLQSDNLMTSVTASFVKGCMQEIVYGDVRNCKSVEGEPQVGQKLIHIDITKPDTLPCKHVE